ncbi:MAG: hypothetical protein RL481_2418 [Pseudomonadota bacterium]|jgi:hypothetical protein
MGRMLMALQAAALAVLPLVPVAAEQQAAATSYPPAPTPAAELEFTRTVLGTWNCVGEMPAGAVIPGAPATPYTSSHVFTELLGGFGYRIDYLQQIDGPHPFRMDGRQFFGWDKGTDRLVYLWLDTMGTAALGSSDGWRDGVLVLTGTGAIPVPDADGVPVPRPAGVRDIYTVLDDRLTWQGLIKPEGAPDWIVIGNDSCARAEAAPNP